MGNLSIHCSQSEIYKGSTVQGSPSALGMAAICRPRSQTGCVCEEGAALDRKVSPNTLVMIPRSSKLRAMRKTFHRHFVGEVLPWNPDSSSSFILIIKVYAACGFSAGRVHQARCRRDGHAGITCNLSETAKDHAKWPITLPFSTGFCPLHSNT